MLLDDQFFTLFATGARTTRGTGVLPLQTVGEYLAMFMTLLMNTMLDVLGMYTLYATELD